MDANTATPTRSTQSAVLPDFTRLTVEQIRAAMENARYDSLGVQRARFYHARPSTKGVPEFMYQIDCGDDDADGMVYVSVTALGLVVAEF